MDEHTVIVPILSFRYPDNHVTEKLGLCEQFFERKMCVKSIYTLEVRKISFVGSRSQPTSATLMCTIHTSSLFVDVV